uniref:Uncharacterized protein n=1 Tax=Arundo donax TaxID=35708 RepID=A0A0A9GS12_ARUDO
MHTCHLQDTSCTLCLIQNRYSLCQLELHIKTSY